MKRYVPLLLLLWQTALKAQSFTDSLTFSFYNNNFFYDKEYGNFIADGYTLPGHILIPRIHYPLTEHWTLSGGVYAVKFWGNAGKFQTKPLFSLSYRNRRHSWRFGNLTTWEGRPYLWRPLYDEEFRLRPGRLETGAEYHYQTALFSGGFILDWHRFIRPRDTLRERLNFTGFIRPVLFKTHKWQGRLPAQVYIHHRGGQINLKGKYLRGKNDILSVLSAGAGPEILYRLDSRSDVVFFAYAMMHTMNSNNPEELGFRNGKALFTGISWYSTQWSVSFSFWYADRFNAPLGEDIFQTVSRRVDKYYTSGGEPIPIFSRHREPVRQLWINSVRYKKNISKRFSFYAKAECFYQPYRSAIPQYPFLRDVVNHIDLLVDVEWIYRF